MRLDQHHKRRTRGGLFRREQGFALRVERVRGAASFRVPFENQYRLDPEAAATDELAVRTAGILWPCGERQADAAHAGQSHSIFSGRLEERSVQ
jgi:hypothetical protein